MRKLRWTAAIALFLAASAASGQVEEIFSRHVRIFHPRGDFPQLLVRQNPPVGAGWKKIEGPDLGFRLSVPANAAVDSKTADSRLLEVVLPGSQGKLRPTLRIDRFTPSEGDPTEVDANYADQYAVEYPKGAFGGKFTVTDSGLVTRDRRISFAMVGGTYATSTTEAYRVHWQYLGKDQQYYATFDCSSREWPGLSDQVAQMLLSWELDRKKGK